MFVHFRSASNTFLSIEVSEKRPSRALPNSSNKSSTKEMACATELPSEAKFLNASSCSEPSCEGSLMARNPNMESSFLAGIFFPTLIAALSKDEWSGQRAVKRDQLQRNIPEFFTRAN